MPNRAMPARPVRRRGCSTGEPAPGFRLLREGSSGSAAAAPARGEPPAPLALAAAAQGSCSGVARCPGLAPAAAARAAACEQAAALPEAREGGARGRLRRAGEGGRGEGRSPLSRKLPPPPSPALAAASRAAARLAGVSLAPPPPPTGGEQNGPGARRCGGAPVAATWVCQATTSTWAIAGAPASGRPMPRPRPLARVRRSPRRGTVARQTAPSAHRLGRPRLYSREARSGATAWGFRQRWRAAHTPSPLPQWAGGLRGARAHLCGGALVAATWVCQATAARGRSLAHPRRVG